MNINPSVFFLDSTLEKRIDIFDIGFENKVSTKLEELGIRPFKRDKYLEKIDLILKDEEMTINFKNAIYERLMENCKEPRKQKGNLKIESN